MPNRFVKFAVRISSTLLAFAACGGPCRAELTVQKVWPDKVFYHPGETAQFEIIVSNPDAAPASAQLDVSLIRDLTTPVGLLSEAITVPAKQTKSWKLPWKAQPWLGTEVRATLRREGTVLALGQEFFTCARTQHQVWLPLQFDLATGMSKKDMPAYLERLANTYRQYYCNGSEQFAWAPSDYDDLTPLFKDFWAGQTGYRQRVDNLIAIHNTALAAGAVPITYGRAAGAGFPTFDLMRARPELPIYVNGRPVIEAYDVAHLAFMKTITPGREDDERGVPGTPAEMEKAGYAGAGKYAPYTPGGQSSSMVWYDSNNDAVIRLAASEFGKSALSLGYGGTRFDGEFATLRHEKFDGTWTSPPGFDADAADVQMIRNLKKYTWATKPGYLFGYNTHVDFRWNVKTNTAPLAFREKCKDDGLIAREGLAFPGNVPWEKYTEVVRHDSDLARYYGGHSAIYPTGRDPRYLYCFIIPFAQRAHVMYAYNGSKLPINKFVTRNAAVLFDDGVHAWAQGADNIEVKASRKLWWQQFTAVRSVGTAAKPRTQFMLHLINPPESKTTLGTGANPAGDDKDQMPAEPATEVTVRWKKPEGFRRALVTDLDRCDSQDVATETDGEWLVMKLPPVGHWSILVVEADTATPAAVWELSPEDANLKTATAADLGLTANTSNSAQFSITTQTEDLGLRSGTVVLAKELDAHGGAAVHAFEGGAKDYLAVAGYFFPRTPGDYVSSFRLKVKDNTSDKYVVQIYIEHQNDLEKPGMQNMRSPVLYLKGTDFKEPGVYQDFKIPFKVNDVGMRCFMASYMGSGDVWWDESSAKLVRPWTEKELAATYSNYVAPAGLERKLDDTLDVQYIRGLWNELYRVDEAVAKLGAGKLGVPTNLSDTYTKSHSQVGTALIGTPLNWETLFKQDVLIVANFESRTVPYGDIKIIQKWVREGGGLVVLGGLLTLGQADNMKFGWPEMLPVQLNGPSEVRKTPAPVVFGSTSKLPGLSTIAWKTPPVLMYRHRVKPKPGAQVLLYGKGGEPLWVGGTYGKGRVAVFTGTVLGDAPKGATAFWNSPQWPTVMASAIHWSQGGAK